MEAWLCLCSVLFIIINLASVLYCVASALRCLTCSNSHAVFIVIIDQTDVLFFIVILNPIDVRDLRAKDRSQHETMQVP